MVLLIISLLTATLLFGIGFLLNEKSAPSMLSGYRTMSEEEKQQFRLTDFVSFFRQFHFIMGASLFLLSILLFYLSKDALGLLLGFGPLLAYAIFFLKSRQFYPPTQRKTLMIAFYVMLITGLFVGGLFFYGSSSSEIIVKEDHLEITGAYSENIIYKNIVIVELVNTLPNIKMKINGFATSNIKKGWFKTSNGQKIKLIIDENSPPYLHLKTRDGLELYLSIKNTNKYTTLEEIKSRL